MRLWEEHLDPVDREKPWGPLGQLALLLAVIGAIYLIFRFAVVIPEWGWQLIGVVTIVAVVIYYQLAFRRGANVAGRTDAAKKPSAGRVVLAGLVILALTAPIWLALWFLWLGGQVWR